ncbi:MAG: UDP-glucose/GDP-mannose dehydrogenase family protein [Rhodospirillaceae bacterium]|nr:UDP-glucose/GDP-mannose dehydrogenase family protein [Rhodospirillales bacterium]
MHAALRTGTAMPVAIVGTGYVGLVTGACLAAIGHSVVCIDADPHRAEQVARGNTPIHEDGLPELVREGVTTGRLSATCDLAAAINGAKIIIIAVGTPSEDGRIDLSAVEAASRQIGAAIKGRTDFPVVVVKSTVVPGTTDTLVRRAIEIESGGVAGELFGLAMNPEFLSQGSAVHDFLDADRIVIGQWDDRSGNALANLYRSFPAPLLRMGLRDAEMVKYAANGLQSLLISYANQIASLCEAIPGTDHARVMEAVHLARMLDGPEGGRAGATSFLKGGIGFGGSCFPKDLQALAAHGRRLGVPMALIEAISMINNVRPAQVLNLLGSVFEKRIAILGLAFKPGTDDLRESPAIKLITRLQSRGAELRAHDPLPMTRKRAREAGLPVVDSVDAAMAGADFIIIATAWPEYRALDWNALAALPHPPVVLDGRLVLDGLDLPRRLRVIRIGVGVEPQENTAEERT